jgi:hypothetical protein
VIKLDTKNNPRQHVFVDPFGYLIVISYPMEAVYFGSVRLELTDFYTYLGEL